MATYERGITRDNVTRRATRSAVRLWERMHALRYLLWPLGDVVAGALAYLLAFALRYRIIPALDARLATGAPHTHLYTYAFVLYLPLLAVTLSFAGAYRRPLVGKAPAEYGAVLQATTFTLLALLMATYLFDRAHVLSRGWLLAAWVLTCAFIVGTRLLARVAGLALTASGRTVRRVLIIGTHAEALAMEWLLRRQPRLGLRVAGFVDDEMPLGTPIQAGVSVVGRTATIRPLIRTLGADIVLVSARASSHEQVLAAVEGTLGTAARVVVSPDVFTVLSTGARVVSLPGMPVVMLDKLRLGPGERVLKELFDRLGAILLLLLGLPFLLALSIISWLRYGGVFERHRALGQGGRPFEALKFRTTSVAATGAEDTGDREITARRQKGLPVRGQPQLDGYGRFLRRGSLDELPQLWNVLCGQMSLVGPYKIAPGDLRHYGPRWLSIVTLKPGITGMAQVHGRGELTMEERSILDAEYVRDYSLWRDVALLLATIPAALRGKGAY